MPMLTRWRAQPDFRTVRKSVTKMGPSYYGLLLNIEAGEFRNVFSLICPKVRTVSNRAVSFSATSGSM